MTTLVTRMATTADLPGIQRLFLQEDEHHAALLPGIFRADAQARPDALLEAWIEGPESDVILALAGDHVVGLVDVRVGGRPDYPMFIPKRLAVIENMVVDEEHRGRGIGTRLLAEARSWAEARGLEAMQLTVWSENVGAVRLYERQGYRRVIQRMEMDL